MGPFATVFNGDPGAGITAVTWRLRPGEEYGFTLFDVADRLRSRGWLVPAYSLPANREDLPVQRIIVRHGFSRDMADLLLADMRAAVRALQAAPPSHPGTASAHGSFSHDASPAR